MYRFFFFFSSTCVPAVTCFVHAAWHSVLTSRPLVPFVPLFLQAFLDDHVELRASASFGDVSAMVEHWMSLEDNDDADNFEDESGMEGFTF